MSDIETGMVSEGVLKKRQEAAAGAAIQIKRNSQNGKGRIKRDLFDVPTNEMIKLPDIELYPRIHCI
ncbi:MAG: hypothetical protein JXK95_16360 [Bacteroidales bacterium]|nr:hypothetical protein [Bacteroidales bacterium]